MHVIELLSRLFGHDRLATGARRNALFEQLFQRLLGHPEEFAAFEHSPNIADRTAWQVHQRLTTRGWNRKRPGNNFSYNNVELGWDAPYAIWRWPPKTFDKYEAMHRTGAGLHVLGNGWGMSKITHPNPGGGVLLSGPRKSDLLRVSWAGPDQVKCVLGATFAEVNDFLEYGGNYADGAPRKSLANQPGFQELTVAGCIGAGGHGSGLGLGSLASLVQRVKLGDVEGSKPGDELWRKDNKADFDFVVTHLGRLGPVVEMDLAVRDAYRIEETRTPKSLPKSGVKAAVKVLLEETIERHQNPETHSVEIWIAPYPYEAAHTVAYGVRRYTDRPISTDRKRPAVLRSEALQALGEVAVRIASRYPGELAHALSLAVRATTMTESVVLTASQGLDFGAPNINYMEAVEFAFDFSDVDAAANGLAGIIDELRTHAAAGRYIFSPIGVRFVGEGEKSGLSPQARRARTMHVEVPTFADEEVFHGDDILPPLQRTIASKFGARPHWGQHVHLTTAQLRALWPDSDFTAMAELAKKLDPKGAFANPALLDPVLGI